EIRVHHAEGARFRVHLGGELLDAAGVVPGEAAGDVVHAFDEKDVEQFVPLVDFAGLDVELRRLCPGVGGLHGDIRVEVAFLGDDQPGEELLRAGDGAL